MDRKVGQPTLLWEILTVLLIGALGSVGLLYVGQLLLSPEGNERPYFVSVSSC